jgi:hypothetical protein
MQNLPVDVVGAERRLVLVEPETPEPGRDVHARLPDAVNAALSPYFNLSLARILDGLPRPQAVLDGTLARNLRAALERVARYGEIPGRDRIPRKMKTGLGEN